MLDKAKNFKFLVQLLCCLSLVSCNGGGSGNNASPNPIPTPTSNELNDFFNMLEYSAKQPDPVVGWPQQLSFVFNSQRLIEKMEVLFYQLPQCNVYLTEYSLRGSVDPLKGYYTTNNQSSYLLCSKFNFQGKGCVAQSAWTSSIKFRFYTATGLMSESCISSSSSQSNNLGQIADYISAYYSRQCNNGGSCGFYKSFIFNVN